MVDVTATETGSKKTTVVLDTGVYKLNRVTTYLLKLATAVFPFPLPPFAITDAQPTPVASVDDPNFVITGSGFESTAFNLYAFGASSFGTTLVDPLNYTIDSDTQITVTGLLPILMGLPFATPPLTFVFIIAVGATPVATSPAIAVTAPPANPLDDAQYVLQVSDPGFSPLPVGTYTLGYNPANLGAGAVTTIPITLPSPAGNFDHSFAIWFSSVNTITPCGIFAFCQLSGASHFRSRIGASFDLTTEDHTWSSNLPGPYADDPTWHLLVLTRDNNTMHLYWDGVEVAFDPTAQQVDFNNPSPSLAVGIASGPFFNAIGTGAVWFRALSAQDVTDLYTLTTFPP